MTVPRRRPGAASVSRPSIASAASFARSRSNLRRPRGLAPGGLARRICVVVVGAHAWTVSVPSSSLMATSIE